MKNLSLKLLQRFNKQNNNRGFTLIELLVVIIIIGILSAIALPSFLNQANKAKETEPKLKINGANKIQMNYYYENGEFSRDRADVELPEKTENYVYDVPETTASLPIPIPISISIPSKLSIIIGQPKDNQLRYVVGVIYIENDGTFHNRICKAYENEIPALLLILIQQKWDEADAKYCSAK